MVSLRLWLAIAALGSATAASSSSSSKFAGCNSTDVTKIGTLGRQMMPCVGVTIGDALGFLGSISTDQTNWMNACSESPEDNFQECLLLVESLSKMAATSPGSLPNKVAVKVYTQPQTVLGCIAKLSNSPNANGFSLTCKDGAVIKRAFKAAARAGQFLAPIQPWAWPSLVKGCAVTDLINLELAVMPTLECLDINPAKISGKGKGGNSPGLGAKQVEDATYKAAISCAYNLHINNPDCVYLINVASKMAMKMDSSTKLTSRGGLLDLNKVCKCASGMSTSKPAKSVPPTCAASDAVNVLAAGEEVCKYSKSVAATASGAIKGCDDADVANIGLLALQALDCLKADGKSLLGSAKALDDQRISEIGLCVEQTTFNNPHCLGLIGSIPGVVAAQPNSLEALLAKAVGAADNSAVCTCLDMVGKSVPAQNLSPTCSAPNSVMAFLRANKATCLALAGKPPSTWPSIVTSVTATKV